MSELNRGKLALKYILFEILPTFLMGLSIFVFVLVMFQSFKLSEYIIVHGADWDVMFRVILYMTVGYLPILFPIALLFAVLMTYGRLSGDSETVALLSLGLTPTHLLLPSLVVGTFVMFLSLQTSFRLAPWGKRKMDKLVSQVTQAKPGITIREGVFSEGFFDLVVYAKNVDSKAGQLQKVFIYDERDSSSPMTIIAKEGLIFNTRTLNGNQAYLRLLEGNVHRSNEDFYTKINYNTYDINLFDPVEYKESKLSPDGYNFSQLRSALDDKSITGKRKLKLKTEWNRRWALSAACLIFAILGVSLSLSINRRTARSGSMVLCISAVVVYWSLFVMGESMARNEHLHPSLGAWIANVLFAGFAIYQFRKTGQQT